MLRSDSRYLNNDKFISFLIGICEPSLSGIHDSPTLTISQEALHKAIPKLEARLQEPKLLSETMLEPIEIINLVYEGNVHALATWANIVFASSDRRPDLIEICTRVEVSAQHAWFFFHALSTDIEDQLQNKSRWDSKTIERYEIYSEYLWNRLLRQSPVEDTQYHNILLGVIKTSQVERVLEELRTNFHLLRQVVKS